MKNDSKLRMACCGGEHGTCMRIFAAPLASWAPCYLGSGQKGKDTADVNKNAIPGSVFKFCNHHTFGSIFYQDVKKQNHVSLVLIQGSRSSRFYSVANGCH